jgi:hypothetical protein
MGDQELYDTLTAGSKTVTTAGAPEALGGDVPCKKIIVDAYASNSGVIAYGDVAVDAGVAGTGALLAAGDSVTLYVANLNVVFLDASVSGEGVRFTYFNS